LRVILKVLQATLAGGYRRPRRAGCGGHATGRPSIRFDGPSSIYMPYPRAGFGAEGASFRVLDCHVVLIIHPRFEFENQNTLDFYETGSTGLHGRSYHEKFKMVTYNLDDWSGHDGHGRLYRRCPG
jgi:hypothetical protein